MSNSKPTAFTIIELLIVIAILAILMGLLLPILARSRENGRATTCHSNMRQIGTALNLYLQDYDETYVMNRLPDQTHQMGPCRNPTPYPIGNLDGSRMNWRRVISNLMNSKSIFVCPSNKYVDRPLMPGVPPGDESNQLYPPNEHIPLSYAYNATFFHEAVPSCWYGEKVERPRHVFEITESARLILLVESRLPPPGLGAWAIPWSTPDDDLVFQSHNEGFNFLFTDLHVKRMKLSQACSGKMWTDRFPDLSEGCATPVSY